MKNFGFLIFIIIFAGAIYAIAYYNSTDVVTTKVNDKERIVESTDENVTSYFVIYTEDEVFKNADEFFLGKFNSSDFQNKIRRDSCYRFEVIGWRIPFLSMYRNIISYQKISYNQKH